MPILLIALAAIAAYVLVTKHPSDPSGSLVGDVKKGEKYVLFIYTPAGTPAGEVGNTITGMFVPAVFSATSAPTNMGTGVLPGTTAAADSWAIQVTGGIDTPATSIDNALKAGSHYFYQALQAA